GEEGPDDRQDRDDRPCRRRSSAFHDAGRRRPGQRRRVVGSALDQRPHPEQAGDHAGIRRASRTPAEARRSSSEETPEIAVATWSPALLLLQDKGHNGGKTASATCSQWKRLNL